MLSPRESRTRVSLALSVGGRFLLFEDDKTLNVALPVLVGLVGDNGSQWVLELRLSLRRTSPLPLGEGRLPAPTPGPGGSAAVAEQEPDHGHEEHDQGHGDEVHDLSGLSGASNARGHFGESQDGFHLPPPHGMKEHRSG